MHTILSSSDQQARKKLNLFYKKLKEITLSELTQGKLRPPLATDDVIKVGGFSYGEKGANYTQSSRETKMIPDWRGPSFPVHDLIGKTSEYNETAAWLQSEYGNKNATNQFEQYTFRLIIRVLESLGKITDDELSRDTEVFLRDLKNEPHPIEITIFLSGLTLESSSIKLDDVITLRQTQESDLLNKHIVSESKLRLPMPSSVMIINGFATTLSLGLDINARRNFALLCLFRTTSLSQDYKQVAAETVRSGAFAHSGYNPSFRIWQNYFITATDENVLEYFLKNCKIPESILDKKKPDLFSTAYDRYREAVLEDVSTERRIANAVMGIEALLSKDGYEIRFRVSFRAACLLGCVGANKLDIKKLIGHAYDVRSKFAHGDFLDQTDISKYERAYESRHNFEFLVVDTLRQLLIVCSQLSLKKDELFLFLDNALLDAATLEKLSIMVRRYRQLVQNEWAEDSEDTVSD